ncbi:MAG TPA: bifunctional metallophosphatase/5'-nucleotidase [Aquabacterium sp.]|uniref:bifunctional metallophosphatase/5'-nucleotidase n=1 Tax=Aquabacterium sp. TaxID=1872578 RepID=UPI002E35848A|nr:bifunctional metallophosphatase/5'-nucleotidase [Aquabacterium sp.]HEX5372102.1 bifunctional metallophosphatase/5'-nucleotidase [Aquabacterium sp.]
MSFPSVVVLSTALLAFGASAAASAACVPGSSQGQITFGSFTTAVPNRVTSVDCATLDDAFLDEQAWGNQGSFVAHVSRVSFDLQKAGQLSSTERIKLLQAATASGVGTRLTVKLIGFNDFHGNLESAALSSPAGNPGVARFATKVAELKALNPLHAVVSAGDMIGASPLVSALFHDEPTIEAMNRIGIDFNAVGNHEFDEGAAEILRMQHGGNHPTDIFSGKGLPQDLNSVGQFAGARFQFLAANVQHTASGETLLPGVGVKNFLGNKVAFVGMTLEATPTIVSPSGVAGLTFRDEADTVNALVPQIKAQGIETVIVLIHEGGSAAGGINGCTGVSGPIVDIVNRLDPAIDLVISGHTHAAYNCLIPNRAGQPVRVTSAGQYGRYLSDIDLTLDTRTKDMVSVTASNVAVPNTTAVIEHPNLTPLVAHYQAESAVPASRVIGKITAAISRTANAAGESALGDVIADAQLDATNDAGFGDAVMALMNPGGIRADLPYNADGLVTYGNAFTVQPFGNSLVTLTLSGAQIKTLLETQFVGCHGQTQQRILQISTGLTYSYLASAGCDARVSDIAIHGVPVAPDSHYRVTVNSFLADGGDGFTVLKSGTDRLGGAVDTDAFEAYLQAHPAGVAPGPQNRITRLP